MRTCTKCGEAKPATLEFFVPRGSGWTSHCRECRRAYNREKARHRPLLYSVWTGMRGRCNNRNDQDYRHYGERGVRVCGRWDSYASFETDMAPRPSLEHSIDRIDNDGDYEPANCRWATQKEQVRNTRRNRSVTIDGATRILAEWCELLNIKMHTVHARMRRGWSVHDSITRPVRRGRTTPVETGGAPG